MFITMYSIPYTRHFISQLIPTKKMSNAHVPALRSKSLHRGCVYIKMMIQPSLQCKKNALNLYFAPKG